MQINIRRGATYFSTRVHTTHMSLHTQVFCQLIELNPFPRRSSGATSSRKLAEEFSSSSGSNGSSSSSCKSLDASVWDAFQWSPDYIGLDLAPYSSSPDAAGFFSCPAGRWRAVSQPEKAMAFDFQKGRSNVLHWRTCRRSEAVHTLTNEHLPLRLPQRAQALSSLMPARNSTCRSAQLGNLPQMALGEAFAS